MQNRLIIIPDVHGRDFWREAVKVYPEDEFIFLGDYLDPYPDECFSIEQAWQGLLDIIEFKKRNPERVTLLWGNHDLHYLYPEYLGSRYDFDNAERNAHAFWDNQSLFKLAYETSAGGKRYLFSHAGVGRKWILGRFPFLNEEDLTAELFNDLVGHPKFMEVLGDVSRLRGGDRDYGSMIWADYMEHLDRENRLDGVIQIFGHTQIEKPFSADGHFYCLDCCQTFCLDLSKSTIQDAVTGR